MAEKSLKKNSFFYTIKTLLGIIFPIITFPYASRILLPDGIGKINFVNSIIDYFVLFAGLGIAAYSIRESAKVKNDKILFSKFATEIIVINFFTTLISLGLLAITLIFSEKLAAYRTLLILGSCKIIFETFGLEWLYKAQEEFGYIAKRTFVFQIISIIFLFLFVRSPADINFYMIFTVLSSSGANLCNIIYSRKFFKFSLKYDLAIKKHLKPIFILFASAVATSVFTILDTTMLGIMKGDTEVGYYAAATKISKMLVLTLSAVTGVLLPRLSYFVETDEKKYFDLLQKGANILQAVSIPVTAGLIVLAEPITYLFCGKNYEPSILCMQILAPTIFIILFNSFFSDLVFLSHKKDSYIMYPVLLGSVINFLLNLFLIPRYSILGAAVASIIAELSILFVKLILSFKILSSTGRLFTKLYQYMLATFIMVGIVKLISIKMQNSIQALLIAIFMGILVYGGSLLIMKNTYFLQILQTILKKYSKGRIL